MATSWAETIEGSIAGDDEWAFLGRYRTRLLLSVVPQGVDRNTELKRRLQFWEEGQFDELVARVCGQQAVIRARGRSIISSGGEEQKGRTAKQQVVAGAVSKAM